MPKPSSLQPSRLPSRTDGREWCLNVPSHLSPTGKRQRLFFRTKLDAELEAELLKTRKVNFGHSLSAMSPERIAEASACFIHLERNAPGVTLTAAVAGFLEQHRARTASVPMAVLWDRFTQSRAEEDYQKDLARTFRRLKPLAHLIASDVRAEQIESALEGFPPTYRNAALRYLRAAFNFGIPKWLKENPIDQIEFTKIINDGVEVIGPERVSELLFDALANDLGLVPWHVFTFFAGVRPEGEMSKLLWTDVDLAAKKHHITIRPSVAKKRRKRWIDLSPNALAWLETYRSAGGEMEGKVVPFSASTLRRKRRRNARPPASSIGHSRPPGTPGVRVGCVHMATSTAWCSRPGTNRHRSSGTIIIKR
jgi:integrase